MMFLKYNRPKIKSSDRTIMIKKGRATGRSTMHTSLLSDHIVTGVELLSEVKVANYDELSFLIESSADDWPEGWAGSGTKKKRNRVRALSIKTGTYISVRLTYDSPGEFLFFIGTNESRTFLRREHYQQNKLGRMGHHSYSEVGMGVIFEAATKQEKENLIFFMDVT